MPGHRGEFSDIAKHKSGIQKRRIHRGTLFQRDGASDAENSSSGLSTTVKSRQEKAFVEM